MYDVGCWRKLSEPTAKLKIEGDKLERLIFSKYLLRQADIHRGKGRPLSSFSILIMHDHVECFLQICIETLLPPAKKDKSNILINTATKINEALVKRKESQTISLSFIKTLNELRNQLKHATIFIDQKNIDSLFQQCEIFFTEFTALIFQLDSNSISLCSLIRNQKVSSNLINSEAELNQKMYGKAMVSITKAFRELEHAELIVLDENGYNILRKSRGPNYTSMSRMTMSKQPDAVTRELMRVLEKDLVVINDSIFDLQKVLSYGMDYRQFLKFKSLLPTIHVFYEKEGLDFKEPGEHYLMEQNYNEEKVKFCFDFVVDLAISIE